MQQSDLLEGLGSYGNHAQDEADLRARVAAWLASHDGLRSSGKTAAEYETMMFPHDTEAFRRSAADTMWSCALRFLALLRHLGVPHDILAEPYERRWHKGGAVVDAGNVARAFGALCEYGALAAYEPQAGDALCSQGPSGPHVSCVTKATWEPGARLVLECVDGGQGRKGDMAIARNVYLLDRRTTGPALRSVENRSLDDPGPPMPLVWGVDLWKLVLAAGLLKALAEIAPARPAPCPSKQGAAWRGARAERVTYPPRALLLQARTGAGPSPRRAGPPTPRGSAVEGRGGRGRENGPHRFGQNLRRLERGEVRIHHEGTHAVAHPLGTLALAASLATQERGERVGRAVAPAELVRRALTHPGQLGLAIFVMCPQVIQVALGQCAQHDLARLGDLFDQGGVHDDAIVEAAQKALVVGAVEPGIELVGGVALARRRDDVGRGF